MSVVARFRALDGSWKTQSLPEIRPQWLVAALPACLLLGVEETSEPAVYRTRKFVYSGRDMYGPVYCEVKE